MPSRLTHRPVCQLKTTALHNIIGKTLVQNALEAENRAQRRLSDKGSIATGPLSVKMGVPGSTDCKSKGPEARESLVGGSGTMVGDSVGQGCQAPGKPCLGT